MTDNAYSPPTAKLGDPQTVFDSPEVRKGMLTAWILFTVIATLGGAVLGGVAGGIVGALARQAEVGMVPIQLMSAGIGFLLGLVLSYFTFMWVLKRFVFRALRLAVSSM